MHTMHSMWPKTVWNVICDVSRIHNVILCFFFNKKQDANAINMPFKRSTYCVNPFLTHFRWIVVVRWLHTFPMKVQNTIYDQFSCSLTTISLQDNTSYHSFFIPSICNNFIRTKSHLLASCEPQQKNTLFSGSEFRIFFYSFWSKTCI